MGSVNFTNCHICYSVNLRGESNSPEETFLARLINTSSSCPRPLELITFRDLQRFNYSKFNSIHCRQHFPENSFDPPEVKSTLRTLIFNMASLRKKVLDIERPRTESKQSGQGSKASLDNLSRMPEGHN